MVSVCPPIERHLSRQNVNRLAFEKQARNMGVAPNFDARLRQHRLGPLTRDSAPHTLQINVGKLCNQTCHHCHVDAGPKRTEVMTQATATRVAELIRLSACVTTVDITGGAPELNTHFRLLVEEARSAGRTVLVRCNLTVLFVPGMEWLPEFYRANSIALICSLPCYSAENVEKQRGRGVFDQSIEALRTLNRLGFGTGELRLDLVYNPVGPFLPPSQAALEERYRSELRRNFGIEFDRLLTITNMPIARYAAQLRQWSRYAEYMGLLVNHFNSGTVENLMCRHLVSVSWDGLLYDCDFNQMLRIPIGEADGRPLSIWEVADLGEFAGTRIATASHCFGCTAGAGSGCGGALI